jgi:hypothetical protein
MTYFSSRLTFCGYWNSVLEVGHGWSEEEGKAHSRKKNIAWEFSGVHPIEANEVVRALSSLVKFLKQPLTLL